MPRRITASFIVILSLAMMAPAAAQEATPSAASAGRDFSLLRALGLPEINLVGTDTDVTGGPATLAAGRYLVTIENMTADQEIQIDFLVPPDGLGPEQAFADLIESEAPAWFYDSTWAGGPTAGGGQTDGVVVELTADIWMLSVDRRSAAEVPPIDSYSSLEVTGDLTATPEIAGAVPVALSEYSFVFPGTVAAGPQIWQLTNSGDQPHFLGLATVPDGTTFDQLMEFVSSAITGTPAASVLSGEDVRDVYSTPNISSGERLWIQVNLDPGNYAVACFIPDRASGTPHALMGMVQVFTVG